MPRCVFARGHGDTLVAADPYAEEFVRGLKFGAGATIDVKKARNIKFHRLFFSLLNLAFDIWEPGGEKTHKGEPISKNFERFREDVLILAGHYEAAYGIDGSVKLRAKSVAFANCDEIEFKQIYRSVLDVVWDKIFRDAGFRSEAEVEGIVNQLLSYGG